MLVLFPDSNHRTAKRRPALVVLADNPATVLDADIDRVIDVCPILPAVDAALRTTLGL